MSQKILIFGQNLISEFLHTALSDKGYETIDFTKQDKKINKSEITSYKAIIDTYNVHNKEDQSKAFVHNTTEVKSLLDLSNQLACPFIFIYQDSGEIQSDSSVLSAVEFIDKYPKNTNGGQIKVLLEDVYGADINTSEKVQSFIQSMIKGDSLLVDDDEREHYLLHQKDFIDGITNAIETFYRKKISDTYTFFPESSITEIELAHFLIEISELPLDIEFANPDENQPSSSFSASEMETNYPGIWHPQVSLESGLANLLKFFDIPVQTETNSELELENARYNKELISDDDDDVDSDITGSKVETVPSSSSLDDEFESYDDPYSSSNTSGEFNKFEDHNLDIDNYVAMDSYDSDSGSKFDYNSMNTAIKLAVLLLAILAIPTFIFAKNVAFGVSSLSKAKDNLQNLQMAKAQENSIKASEYFSKIDKVPIPVRSIGKIFGIQDGDITLAINTLDNTADTINYLVYAESQNNSRVLGTSTDKTETYLNEALELIDDIETTANSFDDKNKYLNDQIEKYTEPITEYKEDLSKLKLISKSLPTILGSQQEQKYLLLIHDSNEISPMGGNIEAYGLMTASNGNFNIISLSPTKNFNMITGIQEIPIDELDKEVNNDDQAQDKEENAENQDPSTIVINKSEQELIVTDENGDIQINLQAMGYNPDYPTNAWKIVSTYQKATNEDLDGVISINSSFIKNALYEIGPTKIASYDTPITAEDYNSILISNQLEKDQYKSLISSLAKEAIDNTIGPKANPENLLKYLSNELNNKNIMIYHTDGAVLSNLIANNWAGSVMNHTDDYLYVVDSNSNGIKNNSDIFRSIKYMGEHPGEEGYKRRVAITYTHNGLDQPENNYLNSLSVIVPKEAALNSALIVEGETKKQITKNIEVSPLGTKVAYRTDLLLAPEKTVTIVFEFESPKKTFEDGNIDLYIQKQPGMNDLPIEAAFNYPLGIPNNIQLPNNARMSGSDVVYTESNPGDQEYRFVL